MDGPDPMTGVLVRPGGQKTGGAQTKGQQMDLTRRQPCASQAERPQQKPTRHHLDRGLLA